MPDLPRYPVAWSVDARVPDEVRALLLLIENVSQETPLTIMHARETAKKIRSMLDNPPPGKHAIPMD